MRVSECEHVAVIGVNGTGETHVSLPVMFLAASLRRLILIV